MPFRFPSVRFLAALALCSLAQSAHAQRSGVSSRTPIGAYLNGKLPAVSPSGGGTWGTSVAFPNIGFQNPVKMIPEPGSNRLWVIGREGHVYWFVNDPATTVRTLALNLSAQTQGWGDSGLLGITFHPDFGKAGSPNRNYLYLYYTYRPAPVANPGSVSAIPVFDRLSRFTLADGAATIDPASEFVLINQFDQSAWHNGGDLFFGPDRFLYLTNGDEGGGGDQYGVAQRIDGGLFSGVLRIDVDRDASRSHAIRRQPQFGGTPPAGWPATFTQGYFIPNDNPWLDPAGRVLEEFYAIGLRSPHRMSYDAVSGQTFVSDVGESTEEELDLLGKGANYQWPYREGSVAGPKARPAQLVGSDTAPLYSYNHSIGDACVIGGFVYRGVEHASEIAGKYIYGDHFSGRIWALSWDAPVPAVTQLTSVPPSATSHGLMGFGYDQNNEIYLLTAGTPAQILKLSRANVNPEPPATLSATGAFANMATLTPAAGLIPYDVNSPLWSDGAVKKRWIALPNNGSPYDATETITFAPNGAWQFPVGTVLVKHFEMPIDARNPALVRRLETRLLVRNAGGVYGVTYKWRADNSDADLLRTNLSEDITLTNVNGTTHTQQWDYPSRENCQTCHNANAGYFLGPKTAQLNGMFTYPTGISDNQIHTWATIHMFSNPPALSSIGTLPKLVGVMDTTAPMVTRVRSYLDANCAHCHRPGGVQASWDGRFETPLILQNIVNGPVNDPLGIPGARVVVPGHPEQSIAYLRLNSLDATKMPPLAKNVIHAVAADLLRQWINVLVAPVSIFVDDFNDNVLDPTKWNVGSLYGNYLAAHIDPGISVAEQNSRLEVAPLVNTPGDHYRGVLSIPPVNLTGGAASVQVTPAGGEADSIFALSANATSFLVFAREGGVLWLSQTVNGIADAVTISFDPNAHRYWRMRHDKATDRIVWESSASGLSWTMLRSVPRVLAIGALQLELSAGTFQPEPAPGITIFDNLSVKPSP